MAKYYENKKKVQVDVPRLLIRLFEFCAKYVQFP